MVARVLILPVVSTPPFELPAVGPVVSVAPVLSASVIVSHSIATRSKWFTTGERAKFIEQGECRKGDAKLTPERGVGLGNDSMYPRIAPEVERDVDVFVFPSTIIPKRRGLALANESPGL